MSKKRDRSFIPSRLVKDRYVGKLLLRAGESAKYPHLADLKRAEKNKPATESNELFYNPTWNRSQDNKHVADKA